MKPCIVTHISTVHPAFDTRIFHKECKSLAASGMNVNLVITHDKEEVIDRVRIIPLPKFNNRLTRIFIKPFFAFSIALKTKADIFHFHDPELIPIGLLLKICGKKVIYDVHEDVSSDILDKYWIPKRLRFLISFVFREFESFSSRFFDGIITSTPYIRNIFVKFNSNSVNINNYPIIDENIRSTLKKGTEEKEKIVSYIGSISKERGIFELINAFHGTDTKLYLAGTMSPRNLLKTLEKEEGWENVVYFGQVGRNEIYSILAASQAGICTLHPTACFINSVPIKIFEYMNAGLPIVASKFPFWEELLKDIDNAVFVDPLSPKEIREAIKNLIEDEKKCISMGERGIKAVKNIYNWDIEKERLINFYKAL